MKIAKDFILREIAGESILIPTGKAAQSFNGMITLSETAAFIWSNVEKATTFDELVAKVLDEYDVDEETAKKDCAQFLSEFCEAGLMAFEKEDLSW